MVRKSYRNSSVLIYAMSSPSQDPPSQHRISIAMDPGPGGARLELPFVIGVLADLSGMPASPPAHLRYRRFVDIDLDNLSDVLNACSPRLVFKVQNMLSAGPDAPKLNVELRFQRLEDFSPEAVALQISPLKQLLELRNKLADLRSSLQSKDGLDELLQTAINDEQQLKQLSNEVTGATEPPERQPPGPKPPREHSTVPVRRNWKESSAQPEESQPTSVQPAAPSPKNWTESPAAEPGEWSRARGAESTSILDQLVEVRRSGTQLQKERTRDNLKHFIADVVGGNITVSRDTEAMINARIAELDRLVSVQLNEVLHHAEFQRLEASWRGLHFLLRRVRKAENVRVRVLNVGKKELLRPFQRQGASNTSPVARKILDDAAGTRGATPFSLLIGAFDVGRGPEDVELMEKLARLCAAAHVPFLADASPSLLGFDSFTRLVDAEPLKRTFEAAEYMKWNRFRARTESRYVGLVLPGMLMRLPYGHHSNPIDAFNYEERVDGTDHSKFLWGSGAWALAARFAWDFERYGWCGARRGSTDADEIPDLPVLHFRASDGDIASKGPAEIAISDALYLDLRTLGLIPLCQIAGSGSANFFETWSCHKPTIDPDADPPTTYESAQIDCMLDVSHIAHYLHAILRERCQTFAGPQECEEHLREWVAPYIVPDYARGSSFEAAFPLLDAHFRIVGAPDWRGKSKLEASLLPKRPGAPLTRPVEITLGIALSWALTQDAPPQRDAIVRPAAASLPAISFESPNGSISGRDQFIRRMLMAEACLANRKLDVAVLILEDLTEQIDRYHLEQWESPRLITQVWDLLRRCYLLASPSPEAAERSVALLRRICRLDPARAIE
jgi:type VI secretion system protein ImpC